MEYGKVYDYDNLYRAALAALKEKRFCGDIETFCGRDGERLDEALIVLQNDLIWRSYRAGRGGGGISLRDRIVQIAVCNALRLDRRRPIRNKKMIWLLKTMYEGGSWLAICW